MLLNIIREVLAQPIILIDQSTRPAPTPQTADIRRSVATTAHRLALYCLITCLLTLTAGVSAQTEQRALHAYQCNENGVTTFSDEPCGRNERRVFLGYSSPKASVGATSTPPPATRNNPRTDAFIDRLEIKRAIARAEGRISDLQKERNAELAQLQAQLRDESVLMGERTATARPTQVDPGWSIAREAANHSLAEQMQLINTRYAEDIAIEEQRLEQLRARLALMEEDTQNQR